MLDALHRILSGGPTRRGELIAAGIFVLFWFAIDVIQFADWAWQKLHPPITITCACTSGPPTFSGNLLSIPNYSGDYPGYYCGSHDCSIPLTQNNGIAR
jgi:hypothetical protein